MPIFNFSDYKDFVKFYIENMPRKGRGEYSNLANALQMHTTTLSKVFKGDKELSLEQAARLAGHWKLSLQESDYLITLVEYSRAQSAELRKVLEARLKELRKGSLELKNNIPKDYVLSDHDKYHFYSEWYYSAVRLLCDLPEIKNIEGIAERLSLPRKTLGDVLSFLLKKGLVLEDEKGLSLGPSRTFIEGDSPLTRRHHANWRLKAIEMHPKMDHQLEMSLTCPMTISRKDALTIRQNIVSMVQKTLDINSQSVAEELYVFNIDWLKI